MKHQRLIVVGAMTALLLSGCGGGSGTASSGGAVSAIAPARDSAGLKSAPQGQTAGGAPGNAVAAVKPGTAVVSIGPKLNKSASLDLQVNDIAAAAARVRSIATGLAALVLSEQIGKGSPGDPRPLAGNGQPSKDSGDLGGFGTLTLSVPADKLDSALDQLALAKIGTVLARTTSSQDVTSRYVDTESRLKTMGASVERVRALMAQAKDLGEVVALESEMSRREADLESLQSQLDALKTSVERSTLAVSLSTPGNELGPNNGFLSGLRSGWGAFTASAKGLLTGVGAVLPFAVLLALVGAPLWGWRRRRRPGLTPRTPELSGPR